MTNPGLFSRRAVLKLGGLAATALLVRPFGFVQAAEPGVAEKASGLGRVARSKGVFFGAAVQHRLLREEAAYADALRAECNILVAEGATKWKALRPSPDRWDFSGTDEILRFAERNGMAMRGHTLVWHASLPVWAKDAIATGPKAAHGLLEAHIEKLVSRYKGRILSWDVVNEAVLPKDLRLDGLRESPWLQALGPEYIETAFRLAAQADPKAQLVLNDFSMQVDPIKAKMVLDLLRRLKEKDVPVHAVGLQAHLHTRQSFRSLASFCKGVRELGLELLITELDVWERDPPQEIAARDQLVADKVKAFFDVVLPILRPQQILTWGLTDKYTWLANRESNEENPLEREARSLPLDERYGRKPMWTALHAVLSAM